MDCVSAGGALPVFQHIAGEDGIQRPPYADAELPYDVHHLAETGGTAAIVRLLQKVTCLLTDTWGDLGTCHKKTCLYSFYEYLIIYYVRAFSYHLKTGCGFR